MAKKTRLIYLQALLFIPLCFLIFSCAHYSADPDYSGPETISKNAQDSYGYKKYQGDYTSRLIEKNSHYTLQQISFPSSHNVLPLQHNITIDYYAINSDEKVPVLLILPILSGNQDIASIFASYFAEYGFATAVVHRQNKYKSAGYMKQVNQIMRQIVFDHKQAIDWVESRSELDASRIGVFGVSMGGIKSALISALDQRISATIIVLAAGDLPYILSQSNESRIQKERNMHLLEKNMTVQELQLELSEQIECDPINYAQYIDASKTLMVLARFDNVIPFHKGEELKEKIGNPETIYLLAGHYSAIIYLPYVQYQSRKFLEKHLYPSDFKMQESVHR